MISIDVKVNETEATAITTGKITSGMIGVPVTISCDESWNGLVKTAVFKNGELAREQKPVGTTASVPWEVLRKSGVLQIGLIGENSDGSIVIPTIWCTVGMVYQGTESTVPAAPHPGNQNGTSGGVFIDDSVVSQHSVWSSKNTVEKLCPFFEKSGLFVQCDPVEGYPLNVEAKESGEVSGVTVTVCGKNLYNTKDYPMTDDRFISSGNGAETTTTSGYCATLDYIPVSHLVGQKIYLNHRPGGSSPGMMFYKADKSYMSGKGGKGDGITVPEGAAFMRFTSLNTKKGEIQIEIGEKATVYEPYSQDVFNVDGGAMGEFVPVPGIIGRSGVTTIFAYDGKGKSTDVKVSGRADPNAEIRRLKDDVAELKNAILATGANI